MARPFGAAEREPRGPAAVALGKASQTGAEFGEVRRTTFRDEYRTDRMQ
jgi:hypothetical protein